MLLKLFLVVFALLYVGKNSALAQTGEQYPNRTVRIVHQYAAGGGNDIVARIIADKLAERWSESVIVEPHPGGGGIKGIVDVVQAPPDGYVILLASSALTIIPSLQKIPFDVPHSFSPIMKVGSVPFVLAASKEAPFSSFEEFVAYARANPRSISYGSLGSGSPQHMGMELLLAQLGIDLVHVPYSGSQAQILDIVAGRVQIGFVSESSVSPFIKSGAVRPLAVASNVRRPSLPAIPTLAEVGLPKLHIEGWYGLLMKAGTPATIVNRIRNDVADILVGPAVQDRLRSLGITSTPESDPSSFSALLSSEVDTWCATVSKLNMSNR